MINEPVWSDGIDFSDIGYVDVLKNAELIVKGTSDQERIQIVRLLEMLSRGDFSGVPDLAALYHSSNDSVIKRDAWELLSLCAPRSLVANYVSEILEQLSKTEGCFDDFWVSGAAMITAAGDIDHLPVLQKLWTFFKGFDNEMEIIDLMELFTGEPVDETTMLDFDANAYVAKKKQELNIHPGALNSRVLFGDFFDVVSLAKSMRHEIVGGSIFTRRWIFEGTTGIDLSVIYSNGAYQSMSAAAILENILASGQLSKFERGVRYFFGHRVPD